MSEYIVKCIEFTSIVTGKEMTFPDCVDLSSEIVRCKDCKHYIAPGSIHFDDGTTNLGACSIVRAYMVKITPDGFCAWGEKKNEQQEDLAVGEFSVSHDNGKTYSASVRYGNVRGETE